LGVGGGVGGMGEMARAVLRLTETQRLFSPFRSHMLTHQTILYKPLSTGNTHTGTRHH